jgi:hypothetical protein
MLSPPIPERPAGTPEAKPWHCWLDERTEGRGAEWQACAGSTSKIGLTPLHLYSFFWYLDRAFRPGRDTKEAWHARPRRSIAGSPAILRSTRWSYHRSGASSLQQNVHCTEGLPVCPHRGVGFLPMATRPISPRGGSVRNPVSGAGGPKPPSPGGRPPEKIKTQPSLDESARLEIDEQVTVTPDTAQPTSSPWY